MAHQFEANENGSIWSTIGYWRQRMQININLDTETHLVQVMERNRQGGLFQINGKEYHVRVKNIKSSYVQIAINKDCDKFSISEDHEHKTIIGLAGHNFVLFREDALSSTDFYETAMVGQAGDIVKSPMPGKVIKVMVSVDDEVQKGDVLLVVEAMKMENNILAARNGIIEQLNIAEGDMVDGSKVLLKLKKEDKI